MTLTTTVDHQHADGHTLRLTFAEAWQRTLNWFDTHLR